MMKNNVHVLLAASMGVLIGASNAHEETLLLPVTADLNAQVSTTSKFEDGRPNIKEICSKLTTTIISGMHTALEKASSIDGSFDYKTFTQAQAEQFAAQKQEVIDYLLPLDLDQNDREQAVLFINFLMSQFTLFLQDDTAFSLDLMQATTKLDALEIIADFDQFMFKLPEQFATDLAAGKIQKPAEIHFLDDATVDYSKKAFCERIELLLSQYMDLIEKLVHAEISNCTDKDGIFDGKLYMEHQGLLMQKLSTDSQALLDHAIKTGIAYGDMMAIGTFLTEYFPQKSAEFRHANPDFDIKLLAAKTKLEALELLKPLFECFKKAKEQFIAEDAPASADFYAQQQLA